MKLFKNKAMRAAAVSVGALLLSPLGVQADSIDPASFTANLDVGESVTVRKTVTIDEGVTEGVIDVMFLFDTSGSMGPFISAAQAAASDIIAGLNSFGDLAAGSGYYSDPGANGVFRDLSTDPTQQLQNINDITLGLGGGGGDFPELGFAGTGEAADGASWRPGSNRFVIALGDANFKEGLGYTEASALAAMNDANATFLALDFNAMRSTIGGGIDPTNLAVSTGGEIVDSSTDPGEIVSDIIDLIEGSFADYSTVTVSDLGAGLPEIAVDVACVSADIGACVGADAVGDYDRSVTRTFEFDVTFTREAAGDKSFGTFALVDGGIVATEDDRFPGDGVVPAPGVFALMSLGLALLGFNSSRRRRTA
jgi:hypothetical protein